MYVQSIERSMFKKTEHPRKGGILGLSPGGDGLLHCNKVFDCQKIKKKKEKEYACWNMYQWVLIHICKEYFIG